MFRKASRVGETQSRLRKRILARLYKQQRVDAMRVDELFARRPLEDREAAVLRRDQRHRVVLIVHELRGRQVPRAAELRRRGARSVALPSTGSVTFTCSTGVLPRRRAIFAPNASRS